MHRLHDLFTHATTVINLVSYLTYVKDIHTQVAQYLPRQ